MLKIPQIILAAGATIAVAANAGAGQTFRLDVGSAVADRSGGKVKNAVLLVRPLACDDAASVAITGTAEGIVTARRQAVRLTLLHRPTPGVHAVVKEWNEGQWVLNLTATCPATHATA